MSVNEMDALQTSLFESDPKKVLISNECQRTNIRNNYHTGKILEALQALRKYVNGDLSFFKNKY